MKNVYVGLGILLIGVVLVSGCTTIGNGKLITQINFTGTPSVSQNVTIPNNTASISVVYDNITKGNGIGSAQLTVYYLDVVPVEGQTISNFNKTNIVTNQVLHVNNNMTGALEYNSTKVKGLIVMGSNLKGTVKIYAS